MDTIGNEIGDKIQRNFKTPSNGANEVQGFSDFNFHSSRGSLEPGRMFTVDDPRPPNLETNLLLSDRESFKHSNFSPEKVQLNQWGILGNGLCPVGERIQYMPFNMLSPGSPQGFQLQAFHYFVVIDFEATCDKEKIPQPQEIIEFPSVLVNSVTGQLEASFQTYVRPAYHQTLTEFCKELTGIKQIQVDRGVSLSEALLMHDKWLEEKGIKHTNFAVVTWSNWDCRVMLESECTFKRIRKPPYFNRWINLKVPFHEVFGGARCNLKQAVQLAGLPWEGRAHCGLDDARNTANLLALIMRRGFRLTITNSLIWETSDNPTLCQPSARMPVSPLLPPRKMVALAGQPSPFHSFLNNERKTCFCGVMSNKCIVAMLPGPKHARFFFRCGNWTPARGGRCPYFEWAS